MESGRVLSVPPCKVIDAAKSINFCLLLLVHGKHDINKKFYHVPLVGNTVVL